MNETRVALFEDNKWGAEVRGFHPINSITTRASRIMKAPVESGVLAADTKVLDPIVIKMTGKIDRLFARDYTVTQGNYANEKLARLADIKSKTLMSARTPEGFYNNLVIETIETVGDVKEFDLVTCTVTLVEMLIIQGEGSKKSKSADNNSLSRSGYIN